MRSIELWCALAHLRISRFRVHRCAMPRNDSTKNENARPEPGIFVSAARRNSQYSGKFRG
ncbi:hypothetical protein BSN85_37980 [Bradyrhizobium brasilense]|nr:hypothetical protein BSN85_37980 [Bradyrhizobium brasilense]